MQDIDSQLRDPVTAINENFRAVKPASLFGIDLSRTIGLTLWLYGGIIYTQATGSDYEERPDTELTLAPSTTTYVEADPDGNVSQNTSGFTAGYTPLYLVVTDADAITDYSDYRVMLAAFAEAGAVSIVRLTQAEHDALPVKSPNRLYITTDTGNMYLGDLGLAGSST